MPDQVKKKQKDMESENPLKPSLALLAKLGSIVAHVAEAMTSICEDSAGRL